MRDWLKEARQVQRLTQKQMADALGISEPYYSLIESGDRQKKMDVSMLINIGNVLGLSIEDIIRKEEISCQPQRTTASAATGANT